MDDTLMVLEMIAVLKKSDDERVMAIIDKLEKEETDGKVSQDEALYLFRKYQEIKNAVPTL